MGLDQINEEFESTGRLSPDSLRQLRDALHGADPFDAISVAADCAAVELAPEIAGYLDASDPMVRWNAVGTLFTRFKTPKWIDKALKIASTDESTMVRAIALCGLGEALPRINNTLARREIASFLLLVFGDERLYLELRSAAYEGILAALGVSPVDRPSASKQLDFSEVDSAKINEFRSLYS